MKSVDDTKSVDDNETEMTIPIQYHTKVQYQKKNKTMNIEVRNHENERVIRYTAPAGPCAYMQYTISFFKM